jgi:hypothetical protein
MFMAAGLITVALGHDRVAGLVGIGRVLPIWWRPSSCRSAC